MLCRLIARAWLKPKWSRSTFLDASPAHTPFARKGPMELARHGDNARKRSRQNGGRGARAGKSVQIPSFISFADLSKKLGLTVSSLAQSGKNVFKWWPPDSKKEMFKSGYENFKPLIFTFEEAARLVRAHHQVPVLEHLDDTNLLPHPPDLQLKMPVFTILGHVDHGKTTLLDTLRGGKVALSEPGWITQDTYSFQVKLSESLVATFLDTPGHQNFFNMRANGAFFSDVVLLVVAADEGIQAQTLESLRVAKDHGVPMCVAITKIDKDDADVAKVKARLSEEGLRLNETGVDLNEAALRSGESYVVPISAIRGDNMSQLTSTLTRMCDTLRIHADNGAVPMGAVVEAFYEPGGRGAVARLILKAGRLALQDHFVCGVTSGRVRGMRDEHGQPLEAVTAGVAFDLWGCDELPSVGDDFFVTEKDHASRVAKARLMEFEYPFQSRLLALNGGMTPDDELSDWDENDQPPTVHTKYRLSADPAPIPYEESSSEDDGSQYFAPPPLPRTAPKGGETYEVLVKTNNVGSLRMLLDSFYRFNKMQGSLLIKAVGASTGMVTQEDVAHAQATQSRTIFCLRTGIYNKRLKEKARETGVEVLTFSVFHELLDAVFEPFFASEDGVAPRLARASELEH